MGTARLASDISFYIPDRKTEPLIASKVTEGLTIPVLVINRQELMSTENFRASR